jgi:hypothetical protein
MENVIGLPKNERPKCKLIGTDGNAFSIIGNVNCALKRAGFLEKVKEFEENAFNSESYDALLALCMKYVDVH